MRYHKELLGEVLEKDKWKDNLRDELYKNRSSRKIDSRKPFSREKDFPKTFSLTENQFYGKTYFYTIGSRALPEKLASAERITDKVTEVLSFLILGHLRRTVQEKGKKQADLRRFILQTCSLIGRDFLGSVQQ